MLHTLPIIPAVGEAPITPKAASQATGTVPRLLSIVEILKREYINLLDAQKSPRMIGLHQYNELGTLEALGVAIGTASGAGDEAQRSLDIIQALSGKNQCAFLLSQRPILCLQWCAAVVHDRRRRRSCALPSQKQSGPIC